MPPSNPNHPEGGDGDGDTSTSNTSDRSRSRSRTPLPHHQHQHHQHQHYAPPLFDDPTLPSPLPPNPNPSSTFFESPMITLLAGTTQRRYWAHKDVLCTVPFFRECLETSFLETHTNIIELPDDDPDAIGSMVSFLYSDEYFPRIIRQHGHRTLEPPPTPTHPPHTRTLHVAVHTTAEKYNIPTLRDLAFRKIFLIDAVDAEFLSFLRDVYTTTPPTSKLRYCNRMEEYWVFGLHERIKEMRRTGGGRGEQELMGFVREVPEFGRDLVWSLSFAVDCAFAAVGVDMDRGWHRLS